jgi:glycerate-2-kinase
MIRISIQNQLTSDEIAEIVSPPTLTDTANRRPPAPILPEPGRQAARSMRRFVQTLSELDRMSRDEALDEIADTLVVKGNGKESLDLLEELARLVRARLDRK